jgi:uncharacterized protein (TIGR00106 family)
MKKPFSAAASDEGGGTLGAKHSVKVGAADRLAITLDWTYWRSPMAGQWSWKVNMRVIADLCLIPIGVGVSVSREIAACERVLAEAGLKTKLHAYGTNIEGEWDAVFAAIKRCHEVVHALGATRISSSLRFGTRTDRPQTMDDKVRSIEEKLAH